MWHRRIGGSNGGGVAKIMSAAAAAKSVSLKQHRQA